MPLFAFQETTIEELKQQFIKQPDAKGFVVDGFPRDIGQVLTFEEQVGDRPGRVKETLGKPLPVIAEDTELDGPKWRNIEEKRKRRETLGTRMKPVSICSAPDIPWAAKRVRGWPPCLKPDTCLPSLADRLPRSCRLPGLPQPEAPAEAREACPGAGPPRRQSPCHWAQAGDIQAECATDSEVLPRKGNHCPGKDLPELSWLRCSKALGKRIGFHQDWRQSRN